MRRQMLLSALIVAGGFSLACFEPTVAQGLPAGQTGWGRHFDPRTLETMTGTIVRIERTPSAGPGAFGIHLLLSRQGELIPVFLGPSWYVDAQEIRLAPNDTIQVTGSRITDQGKPALIAVEVRKANGILRLRSEDGVPLWSRRGRP